MTGHFNTSNGVTVVEGEGVLFNDVLMGAATTIKAKTTTRCPVPRKMRVILSKVFRTY
jgi:hypothetical protein